MSLTPKEQRVSRARKQLYLAAVRFVKTLERGGTMVTAADAEKGSRLERAAITYTSTLMGG